MVLRLQVEVRKSPPPRYVDSTSSNAHAHTHKDGYCQLRVVRHQSLITFKLMIVGARSGPLKRQGRLNDWHGEPGHKMALVGLGARPITIMHAPSRVLSLTEEYTQLLRNALALFCGAWCGVSCAVPRRALLCGTSGIAGALRVKRRKARDQPFFQWALLGPALERQIRHRPLLPGACPTASAVSSSRGGPLASCADAQSEHCHWQRKHIVTARRGRN